MSYSEFVKRLLTTVFVIVLCVGAWYLRDILLLGFLAVIVAIGLHIPAQWLEKYGWRHGLAVTLSTFVFSIVAVLLTLWIFPVIVVDLAVLIAQIPDTLAEMGALYEAWRVSNVTLRTILPPLISAEFGQAQVILGLGQSELGGALVNFLNSALPLLQGLGNVLLSALANLILVIFISILLLTEPGSYTALALMLTPARWHIRLMTLWHETYTILTHWIIAQTLSVTITVALVWFVLGVLLGMPRALIVAVFAGLSTFIPNIGAILPLIPIAVFTLVNEPGQFLIVAPVYLLIQLVESNVLTPALVKVEVDIPLGGLLFAQLIAVALFGALGLILAAPLLAVLAMVVREVYSYGILGLDKLPLPATRIEGSAANLPFQIAPASNPATSDSSVR